MTLGDAHNQSKGWGIGRRLRAAFDLVFRASLPSLTLPQVWRLLAGGKLGYQVTQPMLQNTWAQSAISVIYEVVSGLPARLVRAGDVDVEATGGPARELMRQPQPGLSWSGFAQEVVLQFIEGGEAHQLLCDAAGQPLTGRVPAQIEIAGRREMTAKLAEDHRRLLWWEWRWAGAPRPEMIDPEQNAYIRRPHPHDRIRGLSALEAAQLGLDTDYQAALFNRSSLSNSGSPGLHFKWGESLTDERRDEILRYLQQEHEGPEKAGKNMLTWGGTEVQPIGRSPVELDLNESRRFTREEIYGALRVPPVLAGIVDAAHYNVSDAAQKILILYVITPIVRTLVESWNLLILPRVENGVELYIDLNAHPVMQTMMWDRADVLIKLVEHGVPYNEAIAFLSLPFAKQKWGDQSLMVSSVDTPENLIEGIGGLPFGETTEEQTTEPAEEEEATEEEEQEQQEEEEASAWAGIRQEKKVEERQIRSQIPRIRQRYRAHFVRASRELQKRLERELKSRQSSAISHQHKAASEEEAERIARRVLLNLADEQARLRKLVGQYFPQAIEDTLRAELKRLKIPQEQIEPLVRKALKGRYMEGLMRTKAAKIGGIAVTDRNRVRRQLVEGLKKNETIQELAGRIQSTVGPGRAMTIARTEAGQAVSTARFVAAGAAGANGKGWITGANPRPTHVSAGQKYHPRNNPIPMAERFQVGGDRLMYPRDPAGSAGEIVNCNCVMVTVRIKQDKQGARIIRMVNAICAGSYLETSMRSAA